jgi:hypothetical protein
MGSPRAEPILRLTCTRYQQTVEYQTMSPKQEPDSKGWWQTLPGLLTAAAGIITAVTGLLVAVHQTGLFDRTPHPTAQTQSQTSPDPIGQAVPPTSAKPTTSRPLTLPENSEVHSGQAAYKLLSARLDPYSPGKLSLHLTVRMTNNDRFDANFWVASFRLLADGSLQSPENNLDELVSAHSAKEGDIEFIIPANLSTVGLQMGDVGEGKPTLPINLQTPKQ